MASARGSSEILIADEQGRFETGCRIEFRFLRFWHRLEEISFETEKSDVISGQGS